MSFPVRVTVWCDECGHKNEGVWTLKSLQYEADDIPTLTVRLDCESCGKLVERVLLSEAAR